MPLDSLTSTWSMTIAWNAQNNITGDDYSPIQNDSTIAKSQAFSSATANSAAGGSDEIASFITSIAASGNTTLDFEAISNVLGDASITLARVKNIQIRLLSEDDDETNGTQASSITVGNAAANQQKLFLNNATDEFNITNGCAITYHGAATTGFVVNGTNSDLKIVNNDSTYAAKVQITFTGGSD